MKAGKNDKEVIDLPHHPLWRLRAVPAAVQAFDLSALARAGAVPRLGGGDLVHATLRKRRNLKPKRRLTKNNSPPPLTFWKTTNESVLVRYAVLGRRRDLRRCRPGLYFAAPAAASKEIAAKAARRDINIAVYRDQMKEMEADRANGMLSEEQFQTGKVELETRLAEDALAKEDAEYGAGRQPPPRFHPGGRAAGRGVRPVFPVG
jgi:hypothetical protein